jgi:DNA-binding response OmpR family regulator
MRERKVNTQEIDIRAETRSFESSVRELRSIFIEGAEIRLGHIDRALARLAGNAEDATAIRDLREGFHLLAGGGSTFGFPAVTAVARPAEDECNLVMKGQATGASRLATWQKAAAEIRAAVATPKPEPTPAPQAPREAARVTSFAVCADPDLPQWAAPPTGLPGCVVEPVDAPAALARLLDRAVMGGVVLAPGKAFPDASAVIRAVRAHPHGERTPVVLLLDDANLLERIELVQMGATRILPRDTPWDVLITMMTLAQGVGEDELGRVYVLEHDERAARRLCHDLSGRNYSVESFRDLPGMMRAWQENAADLLILGRDATNAPNWQVLSSIRKRERLRGLPVFMLLDRPDDTLRRQAFERGADDYFLLPYVAEELVARVQVRLELRRASRKLKLLTARAELRPPTPAPQPPTNGVRPRTGPVRVLLADDDPVVLKLLGQRLRNERWEVTCVADGEQAERSIEPGRFDLMLFDLNMPFRSGFDLLRWISERGLKRESKIAIISALNREETILRAFSLEADDFIAKPFNPEVVVSRLKRLIQR